MKKNNVIVCGDIHGKWGPLNKLINKKRPSIILQCGDFGYWEKFHNTKIIKTTNGQPWNQYGIKPGNTKIYFCDGNHEDFDGLKERIKNNNLEIQQNVFYMPRKSVLTLPDGRNVLFMGGAASIDKHLRTIGYDWFPEETISYKDITDLPNIHIDIIISHTAPVEFEIQGLIDINDPSRKALSVLLNHYKPSLWYFGHYHKETNGYTSECRWYGLAMPLIHSKWWTWLEN